MREGAATLSNSLTLNFDDPFVELLGFLTHDVPRAHHPHLNLLIMPVASILGRHRC